MKKIIWGSLIFTSILTALGALFLGSRDNEGTTPRFEVVELGSVEEAVSSTGTLQATQTVEVGTQVSGLVAEIYVDYNDRVQEGQLLARIDPTILASEVRSAEASLERSRADLQRAERELERNRTLHEQQVITDSEYEQAEYTVIVAKSSFTSATVNVERARRNLEYTEIRAPISGIVVERSVDVGQTVAASNSAPKLFVIARDLGEMEILALVDEADVSSVHEGQAVHFQVQAYGEENFTGVVEQVRLQSTSTENVVGYTVVISADNTDGALLPGMTASVEFVVESAEDVLLVANSALRFRPAAEMAIAPSDAAPSPSRSTPGEGEANSGTLWVREASGSYRSISVLTGVSDGQVTEVSGAELTEGLEVVSGVTAAATAARTTSNPFQSQTQQPQGPGAGRPPGGF